MDPPLPNPGSRRCDPVTLLGDHVRLEPLGPEHHDELLAVVTGDRDSFAYAAVPWDAPSLAAYVERAERARQAGTQLPFATRRLSDGRVVGSTRFAEMTPWDWSLVNPTAAVHQRRERPDTVEIGYTWLSPEAQRTEVNTEAKLLMADHAFAVWDVHAVRLRTDVRNARSRRAIERLGFRLDGVLRADRPGADGTVRDSALYSMVAKEWPGARARLVERLRAGASGPGA